MRLPSPGVQLWGEETSKAFGFEDQQGLTLGAPQDLGNRDSILRKCTQSLTCTGAQGKAVILQEPGPDLHAGVGGSSEEVALALSGVIKAGGEHSRECSPV